jgi:hypothetical protein
MDSMIEFSELFSANYLLSKFQYDASIAPYGRFKLEKGNIQQFGMKSIWDYL